MSMRSVMFGRRTLVLNKAHSTGARQDACTCVALAVLVLDADADVALAASTCVYLRLLPGALSPRVVAG